MRHPAPRIEARTPCPPRAPGSVIRPVRQRPRSRDPFGGCRRACTPGKPQSPAHLRAGTEPPATGADFRRKNAAAQHRGGWRMAQAARILRAHLRASTEPRSACAGGLARRESPDPPPISAQAPITARRVPISAAKMRRHSTAGDGVWRRRREYCAPISAQAPSPARRVPAGLPAGKAPIPRPSPRRHRMSARGLLYGTTTG